jgi:integrase
MEATMRGNITRRGKTSWRLKFDIEPDPETGARRTRVLTVKGLRKDAERELARLLNDAHRGTLIDESKATVGSYLRSWFDGKRADLSPNTIERYTEIIEVQIVPVLGAIELQKLKPIDVRNWLANLRKCGRRGRPLTGRTVRHVYRVLHAALADAVKLELLARNVVDAVDPPKVEADEVEILNADQIAAVLDAMKGYRLHPIASLAIASGMRRGELLALRWSDVDLARAVLKVDRSLEQTKAGLRFKCRKSRCGRRSITLPPITVAMLRSHRKEQLEQRFQLGMGKHDADALVFANYDGSPISPNYFSIMWSRAIAANPDLPQVTFHAMRHSHAA